jgi:hypothetical protein
MLALLLLSGSIAPAQPNCAPDLSVSSQIPASSRALTTESLVLAYSHARGSHSQSCDSASPSVAAQAELRAVCKAALRYLDFQVSRRERWTKFGPDTPLMGEHWSLPRYRGGVDYVHGQPLDFRRPNNLMYTFVNGKRVLTGVAFVVRIAPDEPIPAGFAGSTAQWHVHDIAKSVRAALQDRPLLRKLAGIVVPQHYLGKGDGRGRQAMLHIWSGVIPNPDGLFAHYNRAIPYAKLRLPLSFAENASISAARGLQLATAKGCSDGIDRELWVAKASVATTRAIKRACKAAAAHVKLGLSSGDRLETNAMAEHGWAMFDTEWNRLLTRAQLARIKTMTEDDSAHTSAETHAQH